MEGPPTRAALEQWDRDDPLGPLRDRFILDPDLIYLDGNSLGPLPVGVKERVADVIAREWGSRLVRSWTEAEWMTAPERAAAKIAPLLGAAADEVIVGDSTSINLYKILIGALGVAKPRSVILTDNGNFPTDVYIAKSVAASLGGGYRVRVVDPHAIVREIADHGADIAVVCLTHVDYRTAEIYDMKAITDAAHAAGALMVWDVCHSVGAMPLHLDDSGVDCAVGCGYKYLNGGPTAPAFLYVNRTLIPLMRNPLQGWMGHAAPFDFSLDYVPAEGIRKFLCSAPPMVSIMALDAALDVWHDVDMNDVRAKSVRLSDLFIELVDAKPELQSMPVASPRDSDNRGSHVVLRSPRAQAVMDALVARNVIGDVRLPDLCRFAFTPLYTRYVDVFDAVEALCSVAAETVPDMSLADG